MRTWKILGFKIFGVAVSIAARLSLEITIMRINEKQESTLSKSERFRWATGQSRQTNGWPQQKLPKFGFRTHTTALWLIDQSSILSDKFDCPLARLDFSLLSTCA